MKIYRVCTINSLCEKAIELETTSSFNADMFLAQIDGAAGWDWDYWIEEIEIPDMFKYYLAYEDWDFGPDESTGEPTAWPVEAYKPIDRAEALRLIKTGRKNELVIRPAKGQTDRHRFPALWCWDAARGCLIEDLPF